ncbi:hypothetical protein KLP28_08345 [Nocardioidaceae bacterium]|nr:hypothetical protein KLP28_08345 [Nocardioidaceae bacterium]
MDPTELVVRHPRVWHVVPAEAWPSVEAHGLLSAAALLDLHVPDEAERARLRRTRRLTPHRLGTPARPELGTAVLRDQLPLKWIDQRIAPGSSVPQFLEALNARVFLAATRRRLDRLLHARANRGVPHLVMTLDTATLVARHLDSLDLSRLNSGAVTQLNHPVRGHDLWRSVADYPYEAYRRRYADPLAEVCVPYALPDALDLLLGLEQVTP